MRINEGVLDLSNDEDLNKYTPENERPVPFWNMIYIGDGMTGLCYNSGHDDKIVL